MNIATETLKSLRVKRGDVNKAIKRGAGGIAKLSQIEAVERTARAIMELSRSNTQEK